MDLKLQKKNAVVTGGTRGIGHAIADTLSLASPCSSFTSGINMIVDGVITDRVND